MLNPTHRKVANSLETNIASWRPCSVTNNKPEGVYLPAEAKLNIMGHLLGQSSLGHSETDASNATCSNGKCLQHSFIFTYSIHLSWHVCLKAWESYPVLNNRLSTYNLLLSWLFPEVGSRLLLSRSLVAALISLSDRCETSASSITEHLIHPILSPWGWWIQLSYMDFKQSAQFPYCHGQTDPTASRLWVNVTADTKIWHLSFEYPPLNWSISNKLEPYN